MPGWALRSPSLGLPPACTDHSRMVSHAPQRAFGRNHAHLEPHPAPRALNGTTPIGNHAAQNGRTAQRACVLRPAQRAIRTTRLRTTPAQRAPARRSWHDGRSGSAICHSTIKKGMPPTLPGRPTAWHSVAARALGAASQKAPISRAQRSTAMPC